MRSKGEGQGMEKSLPGKGPSLVISLPASNLPLVTPPLLPSVSGSVPMVPYEVLYLSSLSKEPVQASFTILPTEQATALRTAPCHDVRVPVVQAPYLQPPGVQPPDVQPLGVQAPGEQAPGVQAPDVQPPDVQLPGVQAPGVQAPGVQAPGVQAPGLQVPDELVESEFEETVSSNR